MFRSGTLGLALVALLVATPPIYAQYFGKNKVQYDEFDFRVMKTQHLDIYYYPSERMAVEEVARMAERWIARLTAVLDHQLRGRQPLILYASHTHFVQTDVVPGLIGEGTGGVTEPLQRRIVLPLTGSLEETDHVLGHELVHAFQFDMGGRRLQQLPLWLIEGMAEYLSLGPTDAQTAVWLRDAILEEDLPDFDDLSDPDYFPYRYGHAAWAYLAGRWGDPIVRQVFLTASESGDPVGAIEAVTRIDREQLSNDWHQAVVRTYRTLATGDRAAGRPTISEDTSGGEINVGPAVSPDGSRVIFFSEKDALSIEMYLAETATGRVIRKLTDTATDPHIDSIQFLRSTGAWSPDGQQFAVAGVIDGRAGFRLLEVPSGDTRRTLTFEGVDEVLHPAWSPDGRTLAFAGLTGGASDLYLTDVETGRLQQLTDDLYADLEPAWSPSGNWLVFVTDRFSTDLTQLKTGVYQLGSMDVSSRRIQRLAGFADAVHIDPQFSPDGSTLYFISSPNGVPNVYRMPVAGGQPTAVTNVATGVIGITSSSPAMSVARHAGTLVYTLYSKGGYAIYSLAEPLARSAGIAPVEAAVLPPPARRPGEVAILNAREEFGLPPASATFETNRYDPDLELTYVGASAGAIFGANEGGTRLAGGLSLVFSDTLNRHLLGVSADSTGGVRDIGAEVAYLNQSQRWQWGGVVRRAPFRSAIGRQFIGQIDGRSAVVEQVEVFRQIDYDARFLARYPFNRATRVEFSGGPRILGFDRELQTQVFDRATGQQLANEETNLPAPDTVKLGQVSAAFVYDTSVFGATAPVLGARSRLDVTPLFGDLTFSEVTADYRRYFAPVMPFTIAVRGLHIGRYGPDSDSSRINPLFLGYPTLVRGYDIGSFSGRECVATASKQCPAFDRLVGSRLLVGNLEVRFPLVGAFTGEFDYGAVPIDGVIFADTGLAWTRADSPSFADGSREFVSSVGVGLRFNAFGYVIAEIDAVRPLDRPDDSWQFLFALKPGF